MSAMDFSLPPEGFACFWKAQAARARSALAYEAGDLARHNAGCIFFSAADGTRLRARYLRPTGRGPFPTVLQFHDYGRGVRGWHYLARYTALGFAVLALENRELTFDVTRNFDGPAEELMAVHLLTDALSSAFMALDLPWTDGGRLAAIGDGFGGGQAIAAAALLPNVRCAVLNPQPLDFRASWEAGCEGGVYRGISPYFRAYDPVHETADALFSALAYADCARFAPMLHSELLLGTALMNNVSPAAAQEAFFHAVRGPKRRICYPKYGHERINFFENEIMRLLIETYYS